MKLKPIFAVLFAMMVTMAFTACGSDDADEPAIDNPTDSEGSTPTDSEDPFIPPSGPAEPLTAELRPVLTDGKKWIVNIVYKDPSRNFRMTYYTDADTIVNNLPAKKIKWHNDDGAGSDIFQIAREENGAVYDLQTNREFKLSYDITPQSSETYMSPYFDSITIISRGTITLMGKTRRAVKVWSHRYEYVNYDYWVEGIGPLWGQISFYQTEMAGEISRNRQIYTQILECYEGDEKIYDHREFKPELYEPIEVFTDIDLQTGGSTSE